MTKHLASKIPLMSMNPDPEMSLPMWKSDKVLLVEDNACIVCCNIGTKNHKNLPIQTAVTIIPKVPPDDDFPPDRVYHSPVIHVKSIVSVMEGRQQQF